MNGTIRVYELWEPGTPAGHAASVGPPQGCLFSNTPGKLMRSWFRGSAVQGDLWSGVLGTRFEDANFYINFQKFYVKKVKLHIIWNRWIYNIRSPFFSKTSVLQFFSSKSFCSNFIFLVFCSHSFLPKNFPLCQSFFSLLSFVLNYLFIFSDYFLKKIA